MSHIKNGRRLGSLLFSLVPIGGLLAFAGCDATVTETASVQGRIDAASFPGAVTAVEARDDAGTVIQAAIGSDGSFELLAPAGHTYRMSVVVAGGSEPIVFPRGAGKLDQTFAVLSAKSAYLGLVAHYSGVPEGGFVVNEQVNQETCEENDEGDGDGECEDGIDAGTGLACADDDDNDVNEPDGDNNDGEFDDDGDDASDIGNAFAVPENNLPNTLGCNDDDDDDDDDDEEEDDD